MTSIRRMMTTLCALALAAGCQGTPVGPALDEGRLAIDRGRKTATVKLDGKVFTIRGRDGRAIDDVGVMIRGKVYHVKDGKLDIPAAVLKEARTGGGLIVLVPGYLPARVDLDQAGDVVLVPLGPAQITRDMTPVGGAVAGRDGAVTVTIPPGLLKGGTTDVAVNTYIPTGPTGGAQDGVRDPAAEREAFLQAADPRGTWRGCDQPLPCPPPVGGLGIQLTFDGPIQPGTLTAVLALDRYLTAGEPAEAQAARRILETFRAIDALNDPAWRRVLAEQFGLELRAGNVLAYRVAIGDRIVAENWGRIEIDGVSLLGTRLEVTVKSAAQAGFGFDEFGGGGSAPGGPGGASTGGGPGASTGEPGGTDAGSDDHASSDDQPDQLPGTGTGSWRPPLLTDPERPGLLSVGTGWVITTGGFSLPAGRPSLISDDGSALISDDGSALISDDGSALISDDGSALISDDGSALISDDGSALISDDGSALVSLNRAGSLTGALRVPFSAEAPKYRLMAYQDYPYPGARVRAIDGLGRPYTRFVTTDAGSVYTMSFGAAPFSLSGVFLQASAGNSRLYTLAKAPGKGAFTEAIDAATTAVACVLLDEINRNPRSILAVSKDDFDRDVAYFRAEMAQPDAQYVVSHYVPAVAAYVRTWLAGQPRKFLTCIPTVTPAAGSGPATSIDGAALSAAGFDELQAIIREPSGSFLLCDNDWAGVNSPAVRRFDPATGLVSTIAGDVTRPDISLDAAAGAATFHMLRGVTFDGAGGVLAHDEQTGAPTRLRRVAGGSVTTLTGPGPTLTFAVNPAAAAQPNYREAFGFQRDQAGNLYFVERLGHCVIKLTPDGAGGYAESVVAGARDQRGDANGSQATARLNSPRDLAVSADGSVIFLAEWAQQPDGSTINRIRRIEPAAAATPRFMTTWAGPDASGPGLFGHVDGWGPAARFSRPTRLALDPAGNLYVAENDFLSIRKVSPSRLVTTLLGGGSGATADFGHAIGFASDLDFPIGGMAVEPASGSAPAKLYYTDRRAHRIKVLSPL